MAPEPVPVHGGPMAFLHRATLSPTKAELLEAWVPRQPWYAGPGSGPLTILGAYRFDDPAGEVGIETFLVRDGAGPVLQVPLTYRGAPLADADDLLVTTMEHSALGQRWVYCGCDDPAYAAALLTTVLTGGAQAELEVEIDGVRQLREVTTFARGSGLAGTPVPEVTALTRSEAQGCTVLDAGGREVTVRRVLVPEAEPDAAGAQTLTGRWPDHSEPTLLALVR
jgi:hypothetical protein